MGADVRLSSVLSELPRNTRLGRTQIATWQD